MDTVSMSSLLQAEEDKLRTELQADAIIDQNRKQSVDRLTAALDRILLRYNAANTGELEENLFGFIADDGTKYLSDQKTFAVGEWVPVTVTFTVDEET